MTNCFKCVTILLLGIIFTNISFAQTDDTPTTADSLYYCPALSSTFKRGASNSNTNGQVSELQLFLTEFFSLTNSQLTVTGFFGNVTNAYVKQFQTQFNLPSYGLIGTLTRAKIAQVCVGGSITPTCVPDSTSPQTQTLSCPTGQTGIITQTRTSSCSTGVAAPTWTTWANTSNTCTTPPVATTTVITNILAKTYGSVDGTSTGFSASISNTNPLEANIDNQLGNVHAWLGYSTCASCGTANQNQSIKFTKLSPNQTITITVTPWYSVPAQTFSANVTGANIISGNTKTFTAGPLNSTNNWTIIFTTGSTVGDVTVNLTNGVTTGTSYLYLDAIAISAFNTTTTAVVTSTTTPPIIPLSLKINSFGNFLAYETPVGLNSVYISGANLISKTLNSEIWSKSIPAGSKVSGGADFQGDSYPEIFVSTPNVAATSTCGSVPTDSSQLYVYDGKTGATLFGTQLPNCTKGIENPAAYNSLYSGSILFGDSNTFYLTRQYEDTGWVVGISSTNNQTSLGATIFPSTAAYSTSTYPGAAILYSGNTYPSGGGSHAANGLITGGGTNGVLSFFTTARLIQYSLQPTTSGILNLLKDTPFISHKSTTDNYDDLGAGFCFDGCRNYGLTFQVSNGSVNYLGIISGTISSTLSDDAKSNSKSSDLWGGIARHFDLFNLNNGIFTLNRYYSYAHDPNDTNVHQYGGRVTYPANPILTLNGQKYIIFNVYNKVDSRSDVSVDDKWILSVNKINSDGTVTEAQIPNLYLWDIVKDTVGADVLVYSETNGYFPKKINNLFVTNIGKLNSQNQVDLISSKNGLPIFTNGFQEKNIRSSNGFLTKVMVDSSGVITR